MDLSQVSSCASVSAIVSSFAQNTLRILGEGGASIGIRSHFIYDTPRGECINLTPPEEVWGYQKQPVPAHLIIRLTLLNYLYMECEPCQSLLLI